MSKARVIEFIATAVIAVAAIGLGLVLMNVRSTPVVFGGFLVCLFAISVGGFRLWRLLNNFLPSNPRTKTEDVE